MTRQTQHNNNFTAPFSITAIILLIIFLSGGAIGFSLYPKVKQSDKNQVNDVSNSIRQTGQYKYINPLLDCEHDLSMGSYNVSSIESVTSGLIKKLQEEKKAQSIAVYYRDLNNGPWFGINEEENFAPASLLKVSVLIAYLKKVENNANMLSNTLTYPKDKLEIPEPAQGLPPLQPETEYSLESLLERMIVYSDNQAYTLLVNSIEGIELDKVHRDLGLTTPDNAYTENIISAKSYASLFRVLYNSSYLSRTMSEYALSLMSRANYSNGISSGLPQGIQISHKFGLRGNLKESSEIQLHDCGIIYYPSKPYLLCVMTKGPDYEKLSESIAEISKNIYLEIDRTK